MKNKIVIITLFLVLLSSCSARNDTKSYVEYSMQDESISKVPIDSISIADLTLICKCWGFVKYYYPNIEKIGVDINKELFEILDNYCDRRNVSKVICEWIDSIDQYKNFKWKQLAPKPIEFYSNANLKWINDTTYISAELSNRLTNILSYRRLKGNYSSIKSSGVIYHATIPPTQGNLRDLNNIKQRLLVLFTYWNVIEYYYCLKQPDLKWDALLSSYLPAFISGDGETCYKELKSLASTLHDSHGIVRSNEDTLTNFIPLNVRMSDSLLRVVGECGNGIPIGSTILSIDGKETTEVLTYLTDSLFYNYSNSSSLKNAMTMTGLLSTKDSVLIKFSNNNGNISSLKIGTINQDNFEIWDKKYKSGAIKACQLIDDICYMNAGSFVRSEENKYLELLKKSRALIVDLRFYPNEMMIPFITQYLIPNKTPFAKFDVPSWNNPGFSKSVTPRYRSSSKYSYDGRIVILVNENTFSQGEYTAMALQANSRSITIGTETCGSDGDMSLILLPGGIHAYFTGLGVYYPNGDSTQRKGIRIDRILDPTIIDTMYYNPQLISKYIKSTIFD